MKNLIINFYVNPFATNILTLYKNGFQNYPFYSYKPRTAKNKAFQKQKKIDFKKEPENTNNKNINIISKKYFKYNENNDVNENFIFNYIYAFLHYKEYQLEYKNNFLKKDSPRICKPKSYKNFIKN